MVDEANEKLARGNRKLILKKSRRELRGYTVSSRICLVLAILWVVLSVAAVLTDETITWEDLGSFLFVAILLSCLIGFMLCKLAFTGTKRDLKKKGPAVETLWKRPLLFICDMWVRVCSTLARICFFLGIGLIGLSLLGAALFLVLYYAKDNGDFGILAVGCMMWAIGGFLPCMLLSYVVLNTISAIFRIFFIGVRNIGRS